MNNSISLKRIGLLSRKEFFENFLPHFKILGIVLFALLVISCVIAYFDPHDVDVHIEPAFVIFGFIYIVNSFSEFKSLPTRADYLNLPATAEEKVFTKWIFGNVYYWIGIALVFAMYVLLQELIIGLIMGHEVKNFNPFEQGYFKALHFIIVIFSVYFFGAATFNTGSWYKVLLWAVIGFVAYMILVFLFAYALFPDLRAAIHGDPSGLENGVPVDLILEDFWLLKLGKFFINYLAAPFFWFMTYLKIKEKEV